jgi:hypothetical protein
VANGHMGQHNFTAATILQNAMMLNKFFVAACYVTDDPLEISCFKNYSKIKTPANHNNIVVVVGSIKNTQNSTTSKLLTSC